MTWNTEDDRLACRCRELESEKGQAVSIPQTRLGEPSPSRFTAIRSLAPVLNWGSPLERCRFWPPDDHFERQISH
jgi:hypothetical protein